MLKTIIGCKVENCPGDCKPSYVRSWAMWSESQCRLIRKESCDRYEGRDAYEDACKENDMLRTGNDILRSRIARLEDEYARVKEQLYERENEIDYLHDRLNKEIDNRKHWFGMWKRENEKGLDMAEEVEFGQQLELDLNDCHSPDYADLCGCSRTLNVVLEIPKRTEIEITPEYIQVKQGDEGIYFEDLADNERINITCHANESETKRWGENVNFKRDNNIF